jgi:DUF4097 and DUF4098 domain-containing protein YvlB
MRKLITISLLVLGVPCVADDFHRVLDVEGDPEIIIYNTAGEVEVRGWSRNKVDVEADLGSGIEELIFEIDGNEVLIEVKPSQRNHSHNIVTDLVITVPYNSSLEIATVSADISVEDVKGEQYIESVSGDIDTNAYASDITIDSVSGDIDIEGDNKKLEIRIETVSGDIDIQSVDGEVEADTVSGDLVLYDSRFEKVSGESVSGDMVFQAELYGDSRMGFETVNGDIDIEFAGKVSARFDIETFNGDIRNCFGPDPVRTSKYAPGRELKFTEGSGDGRVVIRTLNGDLRMCKD